MDLCEGNPRGNGGFLSQRASNDEIWLFVVVAVEQTVDFPLISDVMALG